MAFFIDLSICGFHLIFLTSHVHRQPDIYIDFIANDLCFILAVGDFNMFVNSPVNCMGVGES